MNAQEAVSGLDGVARVVNKPNTGEPEHVDHNASHIWLLTGER